MNYLFTIDTEGGPLLCVDAEAGRAWRGAGRSSSDYEDLCALFRSSSNRNAVMTELGGFRCVAWEMWGAGSAQVFRGDDGSIRVVRAWLAQDTAEELRRLATAQGSSIQEVGDIEVPSGLIAVMWAPESGEALPTDIEGDFESMDDVSIDNSTWVLRVASLRYRCIHDETAVGESTARRLTLVPSRPPPGPH